MSSSACCTQLVKGFSTNTCLPFSSAALASSKWVHTGVTMATASISADVMISPAFDVTGISRKAFWARLRAAGLLSAIIRTCAPSRLARFLTTFGPQYPYPTTPNLTMDHLISGLAEPTTTSGQIEGTQDSDARLITPRQGELADQYAP